MYQDIFFRFKGNGFTTATPQTNQLSFMTALLYRFLFGFLYLLSLLPFWLLHRLADMLYFLIYYFLGYRKKVVFQNLRTAFPQKEEREIRAIAKAFYLHLVDLMMESIKSVSMRQKDFAKRYRVRNWHVLLDRLQNDESVLIVSPHTGNWEWVFALVFHIPADVYAVYQPLSNKYFDRYIRQTRQRYGAKMISMKETFKAILDAYQAEKQIVSWFAADQACKPEKAYWTDFLNQETTFHGGYEKIARQTRQTVLFLDIKKVKRSHYELGLTCICNDPRSMPPGQIVEKFAELAELRIRENPPFWLWSHRRWKHKRAEEVAMK